MLHESEPLCVTNLKHMCVCVCVCVCVCYGSFVFLVFSKEKRKNLFDLVSKKFVYLKSCFSINIYFSRKWFKTKGKKRKFISFL